MTSSDPVSDDVFAAVIDPIEYGRGQLAAHAYLSERHAREIHILRLRISFERARIANSLRYSLNVMSLMREAQKLRGGYWFPTPLRVVPVDGRSILIGPGTTRELQRHFPRVTRAGYARVSAEMDVRGLPSQELNDWLELDVEDTVAWTKIQIADALAGMGRTISSGNVQFFSIGFARSPSGNIAKPEWTEVASSQASEHRSIVLCRERLGRESFRHFLGQVGRSRLVAEAPAPRDTLRLQFGLAALAGRPFTVCVTHRDDESVFNVPTALPRAERQLTLALGVRENSTWGRAYRFRGKAFISLVDVKLRNLGCEMRLRNV